MNKTTAFKIHTIAQFFAVRGQYDGIVLLTNDYQKAITHYPPTANVFLLHGKRRLFLSDESLVNLPPNVTPLGYRGADKQFLRNKLFVCIDYLENRRLYQLPLLASAFKPLVSNASLSIISANKNFGNLKFKALVALGEPSFKGTFKNLSIAIGGQQVAVNSTNYPLLPVLAVVSQFNEADIIEPVVRHLLSQGVDVHVMDNWSNDGSYEIVQEIASRYPTRVSVERFPQHDTQKYEWTKILKRVTEVASQKTQYKWIISNDADEIRWSPWDGVSLQKAISFIDHLGYNVIDYTVFNFFPTKDGFKQGQDPLKFFNHGDFGHEGWHFMQLKTWENTPKADIASSGGHLVKLPNAKIYPLKFLIGHYPLRSNQQAMRKIFHERKPRFINQERVQGWHSHYDKISERESFIRTKKGLILTRNGRLTTDYLIECISGIGIKIKEMDK